MARQPRAPRGAVDNEKRKNGAVELDDATTASSARLFQARFPLAEGLTKRKGMLRTSGAHREVGPGKF